MGGHRTRYGIWLPLVLCESAQSRKAKFETLCYVKADLSAVPCAATLTAAGETYYNRTFKVVLLVGLTELKAQVSWIDPETVRARRSIRIQVPHPTSTHVNLESGEKVCGTVL